MKSLFSTRKIGGAVLLLLFWGLSPICVSAQTCSNYPDIYIYKSYPYGQLCSPQTVTLTAEYYPSDYNPVEGELRWYTSETASSPVHSEYINADKLWSTYSLYVQNGTTVWASFYDARLGCESERIPQSFYISSTPYLYQDYGYKCGSSVAKVQLSSNVSGVTFDLYKLVEVNDPEWGWTEEYQHLQSNTTGYFELWDFDPVNDAGKYYAKVYQPYGCSQPYYYPLEIEVTDNAPSDVSGNKTVCQGSTTTLTASGNAYNFRWYDAGGNEIYEGAQFTTPSTLLSNTTYQVRGLNSDGRCLSEPLSVLITVNPLPVDGLIMASANLIQLGQSVTISSQGGVGVPYYWCSTNGGQTSWDVLSGAYVGQYSFQHTPTAVGTYRYHLRNRTECGFCWDVAGGCAAFSYVDVTVYSPLTPGSISGPALPINYGVSPGQLTGTPADYGNCNKSYTYQWESSNDNITFIAIAGATAYSYTPGNLYTTTYYRRKVSCTGEEARTNTVAVYVAPPLKSGSITSAGQTLDYNVMPALIQATNASGGNCGGSYWYQWQSSSNGSTYSNITGATGQNFQPGPLGETVYFRRKDSCASEVVYTTPILIKVFRPMDGGCITNSYQTVIRGDLAETILADQPLYGDCNGSYTYQWQSSTDNNYFSDVVGATAQNLSFTQPLLQTTYFQRKVTCGAEVHFAGTATVSVVDGYHSVEKSGTFTKNNCSTGSVGSQVTYTVPAGKYASALSQADADNKAQYDVNTNGQTYANNYGYCTYYNVQRSSTFTKNNCASGTVGSQVTYTVPAGRYSSTVSQGDADARAQSDINANGQSYANTNGTCNWYSVPKSGTFTKNNCAAGGAGSSVTYTVAAGAYSSTVSQADADAKAQSDVNANGQNYANSNGYCTWYSVMKSGTFTKNNCSSGGIGSQVTYTVAAGTYTSNVSQADADSKAQNDVNTNGQRYANNNGSCIWANVQKSGTFNKNNCAPGGAGSSVTYTVAAGAYLSTISQADADAKAQSDVNANGQNYANNNGYCTWYSAPQSGTFTKSCSPDYVGSTLTYTVAAGAYSSTVSQADADSKAQNDVNNNGQSYANANGTCTPYLVLNSATTNGNQLTVQYVLNYPGSTCFVNWYDVSTGQSSGQTSNAGGCNSTRTVTLPNYSRTYDVWVTVWYDGRYYRSNGIRVTTAAQMFYSAPLSQNFYRNNCGGNSAGGAYSYSVPQGWRTSTVSQSDADNKASTDFNTEGQQLANQYGTCTWYNYTISDNFYSQNCSWDQTSLEYYVHVPANTFSSTASQADADNQAYEYAQSQANEYGTCQGSNIQLVCTNSSGTTFTIQLTNVNTWESYEFYSYGNNWSQIIGEVPPGTYNISMYNYYGNYWDYYWFEAGCGYYNSGTSANFSWVEINSDCNQFYIGN